MRLPATVRLAPSFTYTPPPQAAPPSARLPLTVAPSRIRLPLTTMPPPFALFQPPVTVPPRRVRLPATVMTLPLDWAASSPRLRVWPSRSSVISLDTATISTLSAPVAVTSPVRVMISPLPAALIRACKSVQVISPAAYTAPLAASADVDSVIPSRETSSPSDSASRSSVSSDRLSSMGAAITASSEGMTSPASSETALSPASSAYASAAISSENSFPAASSAYTACAVSSDNSASATASVSAGVGACSGTSVAPAGASGSAASHSTGMTSVTSPSANVKVGSASISASTTANSFFIRFMLRAPLPLFDLWINGGPWPAHQSRKPRHHTLVSILYSNYSTDFPIIIRSNPVPGSHLRNFTNCLLLRRFYAVQAGRRPSGRRKRRPAP